MPDKKPFDPAAAREDFPIFRRKVNGKPLTYLDSAASAQKPRIVLNAMNSLYERDYANIHRGVHELSVRSTELYEAVRGKVRKFINAASDEEIVFTRGATDGLNLVAASWGNAFLKADDEVIITALEHHSNIVPWQMLRDRLGIKLRVVPFTPDGEIRIEDIKAAISGRTKLVSVAHISNALGTILPIKKIVKLAHEAGAHALIDGAQGIAHAPVDVQELDADFYAFSGHKIYGPTGIGVLYGKLGVLESMPPYQGGGDMIASVTFEKTTFREPPYRFEAGTPPIAEVIGLGAALDYISSLGMESIIRHEDALLAYATDEVIKIEGVKIIGTAPKKAGVLSFTLDCAHPHDIGTVLDSEGVAVRAGHHCAQPVMDAFGIPATVRASLGLYNTNADIDALTKALHKVRKMFS